MNMKRVLIIVFCIMSLFFMACSHKTAKNSLPEKGYKQHEVILYGKRITFLLPEDYVYSEECTIQQARESSGCYYDTAICFWSIKDSLKILGISTAMSDYKESEIDKWAEGNFYFQTAINMVPFIEKRYDENGHVYYLSMAARIEKSPMEEKSYIFSVFSYFTIFQDRYFSFMLMPQKPIDHNFSYEERKIIESIKIEDI